MTPWRGRLWILLNRLAAHAPMSVSERTLPTNSHLTRKEEFMHFRPLHDRVVVRRIDAEEKTAGGIIIPDTAKEKPQEGEIVAVGPGARDEKGELMPLELKD